jgi:RNA polymerase sigma-70 factor (ECF subfamily)
MEGPSSHEVTLLLQAWSDGDQTAYDKLIPLVYSELHRLASYHLRRERAGHILQTTALLNEVYIKLIEWQNLRVQDRRNLFGIAALLMRRVLVDYVRRYPDLSGKAINLALEDVPDIPPERSANLVALDDALKSLAEFDEQASRVIELRFFGGLNVDETAEVLGISPRTAARKWSTGQAWLFAQLTSGKTKLTTKVTTANES